MQNLPKTMRLDWGTKMYKNKENHINLEDFYKWLDEIANVAVMLQRSRSIKCQNKPQQTRIHEKTYFATHSKNKNFVKCKYCRKEGHEIESNHPTRRCKKRQVCGKNGCICSHNRRLHKDTMIHSGLATGAMYMGLLTC